jgi:hypothetical protein
MSNENKMVDISKNCNSLNQMHLSSVRGKKEEGGGYDHFPSWGIKSILDPFSSIPHPLHIVL